MAATYLSHTFNGARYVEGRRVPADTMPPGKRYLAGELIFEKGIPLVRQCNNGYGEPIGS